MGVGMGRRLLFGGLTSRREQAGSTVQYSTLNSTSHITMNPNIITTCTCFSCCSFAMWYRGNVEGCGYLIR